MPVMILHLSTMHIQDTASCMYHITCIYHTIIQGYQERGHLEYRAWFATIADSIIESFVVLTTLCTAHIDNSFDIARLHLHQDCHTHGSIPLLQTFNKRLFCQVLHTDVNGCHHISTINSRRQCERHHFIEHFLFTLNAILTTKQRVVREFDTKTCSILSALKTADITNGTLCQRAKRTSTSFKRLSMETTLV